MNNVQKPPVRKPTQILIVEDEQELLDTTSNLLREQGYEVVLCESAEAAMRHVRESIPALVLIDIKLPGIDGFDLFQEFKNNPHFGKTPVVFLTAFNSLQAAIEAKNEGAAEYITKPFDLEYLLTVVKGLVPLP